MSDDEPIDHEVAADLRLRAATERERGRSRYSEAVWHPPPIVGQWKCRRPTCGTWVDVPEPAMDRYCVFNAELRRRGEEPLDRDKILFCDPCRAAMVAAQADRSRERSERMRSAIIEIKETRDDERQRELLDQLRVWHHPDVDGLALWLRERSRSAAASKPRREL